jgi:hypothetical protein
VQNNLARVAIETNGSGERICGKTGEINKYPRNIVVSLNRPFSLKSFPVDPRIAELYIMQTRLDYKAKRISKYKRVAYLRFKLRMMQFKEDIQPSQSSAFAVIYAMLEGWDVFADAAETKPMYSYTFPKGYLPKALGFEGGTKKPAEKAYIAR